MSEKLLKPAGSKQEAVGCLNTGWLKCVAVFFMIMDHTGKLFFPSVLEMRLLGRIAFPLFAWGIIVGSGYTRNMWRYTLRILGTGIISQPLYMLALKHPWNGAIWWNVSTWGSLNIFFTLALAAFSIACLKEKRFYCHIWGPCLALVLSLVFNVDYGWKGVMIFLVLYATRKSWAGLAAAFLSYCLFWGQSSATVSSLFGLSISLKGLFSPILTVILRVQFFAILALPFMLINMVRDFRINKWITYGIYPAHLLVLYLLDLVI